MRQQGSRAQHPAQHEGEIDLAPQIGLQIQQNTAAADPVVALSAPIANLRPHALVSALDGGLRR